MFYVTGVSSHEMGEFLIVCLIKIAVMIWVAATSDIIDYFSLKILTVPNQHGDMTCNVCAHQIINHNYAIIIISMSREINTKKNKYASNM